MYKIDLIELSKRESESVEWKENVADIEDVIKTAVAFANDYSNLGGGYIVCGAKEAKDEHGFQKLIQTGLTSDRLKEIENKTLADLRDKTSPPVVAVIEEIPVSEEKRILVFMIPATKHAHNYRASGKDASTYYVRIGRETREARNGILRELLVNKINKNEIEDWDKRINSNASIDDIDLLALREYLKEMSLWDNAKAPEDYLSDENLSVLAPSLAGKENLSNILKPKNFSLLLFSKNPLKHFPGAHTVVSIYKGLDRSEPTAERHELTGSIVEQAKKAIQMLNTEAYMAFDKKDTLPNQLKYPKRALQEAVINALVHRDYEINQPTRITVFLDRIEIHSPGALPRAINKEKFIIGKTSPFWRNPALAYFFIKLQLAQTEGQGIPTIIRTMKDEGCPEPKFEIETESVTCVLPAHPRHRLLEMQARAIKDFFISYNKADRTWAEWIAWELEDVGYTTIFQASDFGAGTNFVLDMHKAALICKRTIAVLSPDFLNARFTQPEWAAAFVGDPTGENGILVPVRVKACDPEGLLGQIVYIDLVGQDEATAKQTLLARIKYKRAKPPNKPAFPATAQKPDFPRVPIRHSR